MPVNVEDEMQEAYLEYAMSVIVGRALPDVRDGLKPVHRRILFAMHEASNTHERPYKKSARIVGDVIGKYHPHGDQAVYDSLVRMAQEFSLRYTIVDGQGNFGSVDGDAAAAMRYTEVRLQKIASEILADIEMETVDFVPNYDGQQNEPSVLPTRIPNLLINGSSGIAVGMSTNIPPHNIREVIEATLAVIENPEIKVQDLMNHVTGPDFPTGGFIVGRQGIIDAYLKGHGIIRIQGKSEIELMEKHKDRERIVVTELPYQVNKARLIERIAELVRDKQIEGISDLRDESDRKGMRVVVELKREVSSQLILNQLQKFTNLEVSFGIQMIAIDGNRPRLMNLKQLIEAFILHRRDVVTRRSLFELRQCEDKAHLLDGLVRAVGDIDPIILLIKAAPSAAEAKAQLIAKFEFSEKQAQAILEMRLQRLTGLEREKLEIELKGLRARIIELREILNNEKRLSEVIQIELNDVLNRYSDKRKTIIKDAEGEDLSFEDLTADEDVVVTFTTQGFIKRTLLTEFHAQNRGGKGVIGAQTREDDFIKSLYSMSTHGNLLCLTSLGRIYKIRVFEIPEASRSAKGKNIVNLVQLNGGEKVQNLITTREFKEGEYLVLLTKKGNIKKMDMQSFQRMRVSGKIAITLEGDDDALVGSGVAKTGQDLLICTAEGQLIRFSESDVRPTGAMSQGVRGIVLDPGDSVVGLEVCDDSSSLLAITELGYGKQTPVAEYRKQGRGGKGVLTSKVTDKTGKIVAVLQVNPGDEIMIVSSTGKMIRTKIEQISSMGRATQGVRIMRLDDNEKVAAVTIIQDEANAI